MPKTKTRNTAAKRMRLTGSGKIKKQKAFGRHVLTKKSSKRKRNLRRSDLVAASDEKRVRRMLGC
ncbi:MAG: 50S ribosomal protein L35 [Candidatus Latescibacterota bacterium]